MNVNLQRNLIVDSVGMNSLLLANTKARHVIRPVQSGDELIQQIEDLRKIGIYNYFVLGSLQMFEWILRTIPPDYMNRHFLWIFITHEMGTPEFCPISGRYLLISPQSIFGEEHASLPDILSETYFRLTLDLVWLIR